MKIKEREGQKEGYKRDTELDCMKIYKKSKMATFY